MLILKKKTALLLADCIKEKFGEGLLSADAEKLAAAKVVLNALLK